jgi:hypothetical protein
VRFGQDEIFSEDDIADMALALSKSNSGRKISNNDITIMRAYSLGRTIVVYYDVPEGMKLDKNDVKKQRINQLKSAGFAEVFVKNKINFEMWFHRNNLMYFKVKLAYDDLQ